MARVLRSAGIAGVSRRRGPRTMRRDAQARPAPDRVERRFEEDAPNRLWVADITYIPTLAAFLYLAIVLDVFSRRVVGSPGAHESVGAGIAGADRRRPGHRPHGFTFSGDQRPLLCCHTLPEHVVPPDRCGGTRLEW